MSNSEKLIIRKYGEKAVEETKDILDLWKVVECAYRDLSPDGKESLVNMFRPGGISFQGFDANNEPHYFIAKFLIEEMGLWQFFAGRELNSHSPSIDAHRRMLRKCKQLGGFPAIRSELHLYQIFKSQTYPRI